MKIYNHLINTIAEKGAAFLILLDPDKMEENKIEGFLNHCSRSGVDGLLIGGSIITNGNFHSCTSTIAKKSKVPVIIFPGSVNQVSPDAHAILFLSLISGRNPEYLIGKHVVAAPLIKKYNIEAIPTGYLLIESGTVTAALYMSGSHPVPRNKPEIAAATALAGEYLGMKLIYLEAGSGAENTVPDEMIKAVAETCSIPVIVGGGIRTPAEAKLKIESGAEIIVVGNFLENPDNWDMIKDFADAIHKNSIAAAPVNVK